MWWTNTLRTSTEDLGTLAENEPHTIITSAFSFPTFVSLRRNAEIHPRGNPKLYDLITEVLHTSLQRGIVVMGLIDAFVYAHHYHRHKVDNQGKFEDCMEGRIRFVTAITPAYARAYQDICLARRPLDIPCQKVPSTPRPSTQTFPTSVPPLGIKVTTTKDGPCSPVEELIPLMAKLQQAGAPSPAHPMEDFSSCLVWSITTETHFASAGARLHINNTAELSSIIEALSFLAFMTGQPRLAGTLFLMTQHTLPTFVWERFSHAQTYLLGMTSQH